MTSRKIAEEARLRSQPADSVAVGQALLQRVAWLPHLLPTDGQERGALLSLTTPPLLHQHLHVQSVLSSNGTVYTIASDTPFHLSCRAVSLRMIAVNIVYTP